VYDILKIMQSKILSYVLSKIVFSFLLVVALLLVNTTKSDAASAYISPSSGLITNQTFKVSVYVESLDTEPMVASSDVTITYTTNVGVVTIDNGEFDSYLQKTFDPAKGEIKISATNTAGKKGKVKLASITFEAKQQTGEVKLTIASDSKITGVGSEQLLTETINSVYNLDVATIGGTTQPGGGTTQPNVPETGHNDVVLYSVLSLVLLLSGVYFYKPDLLKLKR
jgi:hypothetical protein